MTFTMHDSPVGTNTNREIIRDLRYITHLTRVRIISDFEAGDLTAQQIAAKHSTTVAIVEAVFIGL